MKPKIKAWIDQIESGKLKNDASKILNFIKESPDSTRSDIEFRLGGLHTTIGARLSDLEDSGAIYVTGTVKASNGRLYSTFRYESDKEKQLINSVKRHKEKGQSAVKKVIRYFKDDLAPEVKEVLIKVAAL